MSSPGRPSRRRPSRDRQARGQQARGQQARGQPPRERDGRGGRSGPPPRRGGPSRPAPQDPARQAVLELLAAVRRREAYANLAFPAILRRHRLRGRDAALATELGYGTLRAQGLLDAVIAACTDRPLNRVEPPLLDALRLGTYQLLRTRIPPHAAVDTTVEAVREAAGMRSAGFVNAVLRRVAERDEPAWVAELAPDAATDPIGHAAFAHAHPRWIAQAFADALGADRDELEPALAADDTRPEVHLLAKPGLITADELAAASGGTVGPYSPYAVRLDAGAGDPGELAAVRDGHALVVDEGSQLVALALARAPLDGRLEGADRGRWLDLCAGPGGKAALLGGLAGLDGATLDAVEVSERRADLVRAATAGLPVTVHVADGRDAPLPEAGYDRVLVDAPCTGLGALRRRPEARWRRQPSDVPGLAKLQRELLLAGLRHLRPGGVLAYVTCSPHVVETHGVLTAARRRLGDTFTELDARSVLPGVPDLGEGPTVQLWPARHGTDAMFLALLKRRLDPA